MKNTLQDLRNHLFGILQDLDDPEEGKVVDKEKVKLSVAVSQAIINSAKVEVDYAKAMNQGIANGTSKFFEQKQLS